eukprot:CAMPEP_0113679078 /NCGR_PEP_ID=MMETSP0038_2-20120614/10370_1 /TAXON_ID=2898 /ORGANISM="Cryptomonas paramecium" /LENGTH=63 /DNA_ID=CAMNT_0000596921 /DNA_START=63 /DNA_END=251 /DNA_ORIENTATION=- /assembly_acc=CAM_ASM_000170
MAAGDRHLALKPWAPRLHVKSSESDSPPAACSPSPCAPPPPASSVLASSFLSTRANMTSVRSA